MTCQGTGHVSASYSLSIYTVFINPASQQQGTNNVVEAQLLSTYGILTP